jgi:hypothetical protein
MNRLAFLALPLLLAACASKPPPPPPVESSAINDCALLSAIGREHYSLTRDDPPLRVKLNGEDLAWTPSCDWQAMGFNLVPAPAGATPTTGADASMGLVEFSRPHYDSGGALVRVSIARAPAALTKEQCRVQPVGGASDGWKVTECKPDTRIIVNAPRPSDATPENIDSLRTPSSVPPPEIQGSGGIEQRDTRNQPR